MDNLKVKILLSNEDMESHDIPYSSLRFILFWWAKASGLPEPPLLDPDELNSVFAIVGKET
jgi:hypothetical protein